MFTREGMKADKNKVEAISSKFKRYLDDCFLVWNDTWGDVSKFYDLLNNLQPSIKFTMFFFCREYKCQSCTRVFTNLPNLRRHKKERHEDRRFTCGQCSKSFLRCYYLTAHEKQYRPKVAPRLISTFNAHHTH